MRLRAFTLALRYLASGMLFAILAPMPCGANVDFRISVKLILDADDNLPSTGSLNSEADVWLAVDRGNQILLDRMSELRIDCIEIVQAAGISQWYDASLLNDLGALYLNAITNKSLYHWRDDAINVYVVGTNSDANGIAYTPPTNQIHMLSQSANQVTLLHELGHNLSVAHTHEDDDCGDTIADDPDWTIDQIAENNFGASYSALSAGEQDQVDTVWFNVMSYHSMSARDRLTRCQMNKFSRQGYSDKGWLYPREPVYVNNEDYNPVIQIGQFDFPFSSLQQALDSVFSVAGKVLVLQQGRYSMTDPRIDVPDALVPRFGRAGVAQASPEPHLYTLPSEGALRRSKTKKLRDAIDTVKRHDKRKEHKQALKVFLEAEKEAQGNEKLAIQLEIAERYRNAGDCGLARRYYEAVAATTEQSGLRSEVLWQIDNCGKTRPRVAGGSP